MARRPDEQLEVEDFEHPNQLLYAEIRDRAALQRRDRLTGKAGGAPEIRLRKSFGFARADNLNAELR
jgi:hypothetical protein